MKKFLIAAISCILLYLLLDTAYYRWGIYFDFHREQDIEVFAATQGKEILLDTAVWDSLYYTHRPLHKNPAPVWYKPG